MYGVIGTTNGFCGTFSIIVIIALLETGQAPTKVSMIAYLLVDFVQWWQAFALTSDRSLEGILKYPLK